jgi:hypothetical protein
MKVKSTSEPTFNVDSTFIKHIVPTGLQLPVQCYLPESSLANGKATVTDFPSDCHPCACVKQRS